MKHFVYVILLLGIGLEYTAAQQVIYGRVKNEDGYPIRDVAIFQKEFFNVSRTDSRGIFNYTVDSTLVDTLYFQRDGYAATQVVISDSLTSPLHIALKDAEGKIVYSGKHHWSPVGGGWRFNAEILPRKYDIFEEELEQENIETLNRVVGIFSFEVFMSGKRMNTGIQFGYIETSNTEPDSIDIELRNSLVGLNFSYRLLDRPKFYLYPNFAIKHYRNRLINSQFEEDLQLPQFLDQPDLDLRMNQTMGLVGMEAAFKFRSKQMVPGAFWAAGVYSGYFFKFHGNPTLRSASSRIYTSKKIDFKNYNWGLFFSLNFY